MFRDYSDPGALGLAYTRPWRFAPERDAPKW